MRRWVAAAMVCAAAFAAPAAATPKAPALLANGVRAVLRPDPGAAFVGLVVLVRAGIAEEERFPGVGAVVAHALFGANASQSERAVARTLYGFGGVQTTWGPDYTAISCVTSADGLEDAAGQIAQAIASAEFEPAAIRAAQRSVLEECARRDADPYQVAAAAIRASVHADDVYRLPFGGPPGASAAITTQSARWYREQWYAPEDIVVAVAGPVTEERMLRVLERKFAVLDRIRPARRRRVSLVTPLLAFPADAVRRTAGGRTAIVAVGSLAPALADPDAPAFVVLAALLGGGKGSRLFRALRDAGGVGYRVGADVQARARETEMMAYVEVAAERARTGCAGIASAVRAVVRSATDRPPDAAELERARQFAAGQHVLSRQRVRDRAWALAAAELIGSGAGSDDDLPGRIAAVTPADLDRVARRYLAHTVDVVVLPQSP